MTNDKLYPRTAPYSEDEQRVCDYIQEITKGEVGCGDDPIGFLIASHRILSFNAKKVNKLDRYYNSEKEDK